VAKKKTTAKKGNPFAKKAKGGKKTGAKAKAKGNPFGKKK